MLSLLLDEHISPEVADQVRTRRPDVPIVSIHHWRGGFFVGAEDDLILAAAREESLTLVTFDLRTIAPLISAWGESGKPHAGVIFIDDATILPSDFGGLVRALLALWDRESLANWYERPEFLRAAPQS